MPTFKSLRASALLRMAVSLVALTMAAFATLSPVAADAQVDAQRPPAAAIRPFTVHVPQAALDDLRRRIADTRWPDRETVTDPSQGVQLEKVQALARYWGTDYDWRRLEAKLMAFRNSSRRSMESTSTSSTSARGTRTRCRSSSRMDGRAR